MIETQNVNTGISDIEEIKTFHPTELEFSMGPCAYVEHIIDNEEAQSYGCVKIVPPSSFKPPCAFDTEADTKLLTRFQVIQQLGRARSFSDNHPGRTYRELAEMSREKEAFTVVDAAMGEKVAHEELEEEYWNMVDL